MIFIPTLLQLLALPIPNTIHLFQNLWFAYRIKVTFQRIKVKNKRSLRVEIEHRGALRQEHKASWNPAYIFLSRVVTSHVTSDWYDMSQPAVKVTTKWLHVAIDQRGKYLMLSSLVWKETLCCSEAYRENGCHENRISSISERKNANGTHIWRKSMGVRTVYFVAYCFNSHVKSVPCYSGVWWTVNGI